MRRNLQIFVGESVTFRGVLRKNGSNERIDLTPYTLTWKAGDKDFLRTSISLSEGNGITITNAKRGEWEITIRKGDTEELANGLYVHQGFAAQGGNENLLFTFGNLDLGPIIR